MDRTTLPFSGPLTLTPTPGGEDPDGFFDFERLGRIAQRRMRVVLLFGLLGLALGIVYLLIAPPTYTSAVSILLDENLTRYADQEATTAASNMKTDANLLTEVEIIKSNRLALAVVGHEHLDENPMSS